MKRNIITKEVVAWIIFVFAAFLFSATIVFAQEKNKSKNQNGKIRIVISENENGNTMAIDTTLDASDDYAIEMIMKDFGAGDEVNWKKDSDHSSSSQNENKRVLKIKRAEMSDEERKEM